MSLAIVPATEVGELASLQPVVEAVFGARDRPAGWFARKLVRECIDGALTHVAVAGDPQDPRAWIGWVLAGRPASSWPSVRIAGLGVLAAWRRRGVAKALLDAVAAAARSQGARAIETWAERGAEPVYVASGFSVVRGLTTLLGFGRGTTSPLPPPQPWADPQRPIEVHAFLHEAWDHTDVAARTTLSWPELDVVHHVVRESRAFAVHRTITARADVATSALAFDRLVHTLPDAAPIVVLGVPEVSSITAPLHDAGWASVQRASIVARPL